jgi:hypothetical protein
MKLNHYTLAAMAVAGVSALASQASADVITDWNLITVNATKTAGQNSNLGTRTDAIEAIAVYDAVNSIRQFGTKYHYYAPDTGSAQAAAAQAAHDVLVNYFPSQQPALDAALTNSLANITDGPIGDGRSVGSAAAADIITLRAWITLKYVTLPTTLPYLIYDNSAVSANPQRFYRAVSLSN